MKSTILISDSYKNSSSLNSFLHKLPDSFYESGEMLWNGRNKIKAFCFEECEQVVVKKFKPLNIIQKIGYCFRKHKAMRAYENGLELKKRGIATPEPVACVEHTSNGFIVGAYYLCGRNDAAPIEDLLYRDDWDKGLALAFASFIVQLHRAGVLHHDLNDTNVRFIHDGKGYHFSVIDINRMDFYDNIDLIPTKERIENMTRFTGRINLFECVLREYARQCELDEEWIQQAMQQKLRHDRNWARRKRILHPFRKRPTTA